MMFNEYLDNYFNHSALGVYAWRKLGHGVQTKAFMFSSSFHTRNEIRYTVFVIVCNFFIQENCIAKVMGGLLFFRKGSHNLRMYE